MDTVTQLTVFGFQLCNSRLERLAASHELFTLLHQRLDLTYSNFYIATMQFNQQQLLNDQSKARTQIQDPLSDT